MNVEENLSSWPGILGAAGGRGEGDGLTRVRGGGGAKMFGGYDDSMRRVTFMKQMGHTRILSDTRDHALP